MSSEFNFSGTANKNWAVVNITPLVDILMLLLIFFIVSSRFKNTPAIEIRLPSATTASVTSGPDIVITITRDNRIFFGKQPVIKPVLRRKLSRMDSKDKKILLRADQKLSVQRLIELFDLFRELGFRNISTLTVREKG